MKRLYRTIIQAIFILTAAASGLRAQQFFPGAGTVTLPELSTAAAQSMHLTSALLTVNLVSDAVKLPSFAKTMVWRDGAWRDKDKNTISVQLLFPIRILEEKPEIKARYKLDYETTYLRGTSPVSIKFTEFLPADKAASFHAKADFPLQPIIIDGSGLAYSSAGPGLEAVQWRVNRQLGKNNATDAGVFKGKTGQKDGTPTNKIGGVIVNIIFRCVGGGKIDWADNGKDLRKLAPDLVLKLSQPNCD